MNLWKRYGRGKEKTEPSKGAAATFRLRRSKKTSNRQKKTRSVTEGKNPVVKKASNHAAEFYEEKKLFVGFSGKSHLKEKNLMGRGSTDS